MKLASIFSRWQVKPESLRDGNLEDIIQLRDQSKFLRWITLLLGFTVLTMTIFMFRRPAPSSVEIPNAEPCVNYADSSYPVRAEVLSTSESIVQPEDRINDVVASEKTVLSSPDSRAAIKHKIASARARPALNAADKSFQAPAATSTAVNLWDLLEKIENDPAREFLDKKFDSGGIALTFHEATQEGLVHFELVNNTQKSLYLPRLDTGLVPSQLYLERRVLEPDVRAQGVVIFKNWPKRKSIDISILAANLRPIKIQLEVPQWK